MIAQNLPTYTIYSVNKEETFENIQKLLKHSETLKNCLVLNNISMFCNL